VDGSSFNSVIDGLGQLAGALSAAKNQAIALSDALPVGTDTGTPLYDQGMGGSDLLPPQYRSDLAPTTSIKPHRASQNVDFGDTSKGGGGKGGGGGSKNSRISALIDSLKTEQEIVAEWYATSLEALKAASDAELAAVGGKHEALERLEKEHQERLKGIKDLGNQWSVQSALDGGAEILGAMASTNKRAAKLQGIFAAASALISTYQGAAKELEKGTFGFASAAAVIAKGIGFVAAIRSASASTGGAGAAGGSSSTPAAAAPQPSIANVTWAGPVTVGGFQSLTEKLNAEFKQGYILNINQGRT
jgi:hypothetical protein